MVSKTCELHPEHESRITKLEVNYLTVDRIQWLIFAALMGKLLKIF